VKPLIIRAAAKKRVSLFIKRPPLYFGLLGVVVTLLNDHYHEPFTIDVFLLIAYQIFINFVVLAFLACSAD
jgi:hypothetical protein